MHVRLWRRQVNMPQQKNAGRLLLAIAVYSSCAVSAFGWSSNSLLRQSIRQEDKTMSFVAWTVLGLTAGFIGSQLVNRREEGILPDILLGAIGAIAGDWLFYNFGPPSVNGLNLSSLFAAVIVSVAFLLIFYALRRI
jgi:uncharacterized membrane protein YeaQ/YmgE (transglycosylase-associated protein family)